MCTIISISISMRLIRISISSTIGVSLGIRIIRILSSTGVHASTCIHNIPKMCSGHVAHVGKRATTRTVCLLKKKVALEQYNTETKPKTNKTANNCF